MGIKSYCKDLFKEQKFYFWSQDDLTKNCNSITDSPKYKESESSSSKDDCAVLNDHIFGQYHEEQKKVVV